VGSSACSNRIKLCDAYSGDFYGSLIVEKDVPAGDINILGLQQNTAGKGPIIGNYGERAVIFCQAW